MTLESLGRIHNESQKASQAYEMLTATASRAILEQGTPPWKWHRDQCSSVRILQVENSRSNMPDLPSFTLICSPNPIKDIGRNHSMALSFVDRKDESPLGESDNGKGYCNHAEVLAIMDLIKEAFEGESEDTTLNDC